MRAGDYYRLLADHDFQVAPQRLAMMLLVSQFTLGNSLLARIQQLVYGSRIAEQKLDPAPLFLLGHWRSGTTLLHELMSLDDRLAYPSTVECFLPHHFLISEPILKPLLRMVLPARRPMDDMATGPDLPQEDEFALIGLGAPTPYLRMAFPNQPRPYDGLLDMEGIPDFVEERFERFLRTFFQSLMVKKQKRLLLKSPTHTGRMGWLFDKFPDSRFIHISRNPVEVFLSTKRLWRSLDEVQGYQLPKYSDEQLEEMIFQMYDRMYHGYFKGRSRIPGNRLVEVRFEQLISEPVQTIRHCYEQLEMDCPETMCEKIASSMAKRKKHQVADYKIDSRLSDRVLQRWQQYADQFGYA